MAHDFDFLRARWPKLAALASDAKRLVTVSPTVSISSMLTFCEWASDIILRMADIPVSEEADLYEKLEAMRRSRSIPPEIVSRFENIQAAPEKMHNPLGNAEISSACLDDLNDIAQWMVRFDSRGGHKAAPAAPSPSRAQSSAPSYQEQDASLYSQEEDGQDAYPQQDPGYDASDYTDDGYQDTLQDGYEDDITAGPTRRSFSSQPKGFLSRLTKGGSHGGANPLVIIIPAVLVIGLLTWLGFIIAGKNKPISAPAVSPTIASNALPDASTPTPSPTPVITPAPEVVTYLQDMTFSSSSTLDLNTIHKGRWSSERYSGEFNIDGTTYDHGLGMYIPSSAITDVRATKTLVIDLGGQYNTFITDYGAERNWDYGNSADRGSYRITIKVDGVTAYTGDGLSGPDGGVKDVRVNVTGAQTLTIELTQRKGSKGTLNIVLGDARLVTGGEIVSSSAAPSTSPDANASQSPAPSASPDASASQSPAPSASPDTTSAA